jgi:nucleoside-diphosphate-sugar epimerase
VLYASSIWVYGSSADVIDEDVPVAPTTGLGRVKARVERVLADAPRATVFRIGAIYPGGAFGRQLVDPARRGRVVCPGNGDNFLGLASIADVVGAFVTACERSVFGCFNLVDDQPLTWRDMTTTLAAHFGHEPLARIPSWLVRIARGRDTAAYVAANLRVVNTRAKQAGFRIEHATFAQGLAALVP